MSIIIHMYRKQNPVNIFFRIRSSWYRRKRLLFASPAEVRFIRLMGGKAYTSSKIRDSKGFPLTIIFSLGKLLKSEHFQREVRVGKHFVDFGNDIHRAIEIDGHEWHMDVVADMDREIYINSRGWQILRIKASRLWNQPNRVHSEVLKFLTK